MKKEECKNCKYLCSVSYTLNGAYEKYPDSYYCNKRHGLCIALVDSCELANQNKAKEEKELGLRETLLTRQVQTAEFLREKLNINIVTCHSCGDVFIADMSEENVICPYCLAEGEQCDFPDFIYEGYEPAPLSSYRDRPRR